MTQHATVTKKTRKKSATRARSPRPWVLRDPEVLRVVLNVYEDLTALRQQCALKVEAAREVEQLFWRVLFEPDESGLQRWSRITEMVTSSRDGSGRHGDNQSGSSHADCQGTYRRMLTIRMAWTHLENNSKSLPLIDRITESLRRVLIAYAEAQPRRPRRARRSRPPVLRDKPKTGKARVR